MLIITKVCSICYRNQTKRRYQYNINRKLIFTFSTTLVIDKEKMGPTQDNMTLAFAQLFQNFINSQKQSTITDITNTDTTTDNLTLNKECAKSFLENVSSLKTEDALLETTDHDDHKICYSWPRQPSQSKYKSNSKLLLKQYEAVGPNLHGFHFLLDYIDSDMERIYKLCCKNKSQLKKWTRNQSSKEVINLPVQIHSYIYMIKKLKVNLCDAKCHLFECCPNVHPKHIYSIEAIHRRLIDATNRYYERDPDNRDVPAATFMRNLEELELRIFHSYSRMTYGKKHFK